MTEQIEDRQVFFDYLTSDEITVLDGYFGERRNHRNPVRVRRQVRSTQSPHQRGHCSVHHGVCAFATVRRARHVWGTRPVLRHQIGHQLGNYIGDLTDELGGQHITIFASGGPKNYGYKTSGGKTEVKVRGITLDCTARQKVNFESMCELVSLRAECGVTGTVSVDIPFKITKNTRTKEIQTKRMEKDYRVVYNKPVIIDDYKTLPYGY